MKKIYLPLLCIYHAALQIADVSAQNTILSFQNPDNLAVCETAPMSVSISNAGSGALTDVSLSLTLPNGVEYVPGSVNNAVLLSLNAPNNPVFSLTNISAGQILTVELQVKATCVVQLAINTGQLFSNSALLSFAGGSAQGVSPNYPIQTGLIQIVSVSPIVLNGENGDVLTRQIRVRNTRLGRIESLSYKDTHGAGYTAYVSGATAQSVQATATTATFDGAFFSQFGNGDAWFDFNEELVIVQTTEIEDCGFPEKILHSVLEFNWGCDAVTCQGDTAQTVTLVAPSAKNPLLIYEPEFSAINNSCGENAAIQRVRITNAGGLPATNVIFDIEILKASHALAPGLFEVESGGQVLPLTPNLTVAAQLDSCGKTGFKSALVAIPLVPAGETVEFRFGAIRCEPFCEYGVAPFEIRTLYRKACPQQSPVTEKIDGLFVPPNILYGAPEYEILTCLDDGVPYEMDFTFRSPFLQEDGMFLHFDFDLPFGLSWDESCLPQIEGKAPARFEKSVNPDGSSHVTIVFALPFADKEQVSLRHCLKFDCAPGIACQKLETGSYLPTFIPTCDHLCALEVFTVSGVSDGLHTPVPCGFCREKSYFVLVDAACIDYEPNTPFGPGHPAEGLDPAQPVVLNGDTLTLGEAKFLFSTQTFRKNIDFADDDDDRNADGAHKAGHPLIRKDRYITGDTLRYINEFVLQSGTPGGYLPFFIIHEMRQSEVTLNGADSTEVVFAVGEFTNNRVLAHIDARTLVKKSGQVAQPYAGGFLKADDRFLIDVFYNNVQPDETTERIALQYWLHALNFDHLGPLSPGDTIIYVADLVFEKNYTPTAKPPLLNFRIRTLFDNFRQAGAPDPSAPLQQYSGIVAYNETPRFTIRACDPSLTPQPTRYGARIARDNMFPYEVRPLTRLNILRHTLVPGISPLSVAADLLLQPNLPWLNKAPLSWTALGNDAYQYMTDPLYVNPIDEGYELRFDIRLSPDCNFRSPTGAGIWGIASGPNGYKPAAPQSFANTPDSLHLLGGSPILRLQTLSSALDLPKSSFDYAFSLRNLVGAQAPNAWVYVEPIDGMLEDVELLRGPQWQPLPGVAGLFQLGALGPGAQQNLRLRARSGSCKPFSVRIRSGWGCAPISNPLSAQCGLDTVFLQLNLLDAELELDLTSQPTGVPLCEPSDWFGFTVSNARDGFAQQVTAGLTLPQGISPSLGTCEVSYPAGAPWSPAPDPLPLPGNRYEWTLNMLLPALGPDGLPGFLLQPANAFSVRFRTQAECGFVSNAQPLYAVRGVQNCGLAINNIQKAGPALSLNGQTQPYAVNASMAINHSDPLYCGDEAPLTVTLQVLGAPTVQDSVYVTLPPGVSYVSGSYMAGQGAPAGPPHQVGQTLQLPLPTNTPIGGTIQFGIAVRYDDPADCANRIVSAQTRRRISAFCPDQGQNCGVYVTTGEALLILPTLNANIALGDFNAVALPDGSLQLAIALENAGSDPLPQITAQLWIDANGNGSPDPGETLLQTISYNQTLQSGQLAQLSALVSLGADQLCKLLLLLPAAENCACNSAVIPLRNLKIRHEDILACTLTPTPIGIPAAPGSAYQWHPSGLLDCDVCPGTVFAPPPQTQPGSVFTFVLLENNAGCEVERRFDVAFSPTPAILTPDLSVCKGQNVTLSATPNAASYQWSGPGIAQPAMPVQTLAPQQSATYVALITLANGCSATDSVKVTVWPTYAQDFGVFLTCPGKPIALPGGITTDQAGLYTQTLQTVFGCDSVVAARLAYRMPASESAAAICQGDTLILDGQALTAAGLYCRQYQTPDGCDSTHCTRLSLISLPALPTPDTLIFEAGQGVVLQAPAGFATYSWTPSEGLSCADCPSPLASPTVPTTYTLRVTTLQGCSAEVQYRTKPLAPCDPTRLKIPNAFTPDGDGLNDVFRVAPFEGFERIAYMAIFNRWGVKVYESAEAPYWDGTTGGLPAPSDVYIYIVEIACDSQTKRITGDVTLMR
ncbi:MAG: gliding motility-associated C-terminal domain-containing protein [Saprospiraceae bacterium]